MLHAGRSGGVLVLVLGVCILATGCNGRASSGLLQPTTAAPSRPNIVLFLTDDLDLMLGGMDSIHQPRHIPALRARGAEIPHWSEILTGKFFHNLVLNPTDRWDTDGHGHPQQCMYINETRLSPGPTFAEHLGGAGYAVGIFGKYLNLSPRSGHDTPEPWSPGPTNNNPVSAPTGVHTYFVNPGPMAKSELDATGEYYPAWFLLGSPAFNGTFQNGVNGSRQYETDLLARHADQWLRKVASEDPARPFFLYMAPHGPHGAAIPAPQYRSTFPNVTAPRDSTSWNLSATDHHWLVRQQPPTQEHEVVAGDEHFRNRWRCMLSVDELVGAVVETISELELLSNTFIFFTSDHGFHFHQLRLGVGKWSVYDHDIRVPMLVSGPGIPAGSTLDDFVGSHADLAPTWLALAGLARAPEMDGSSLLHSLIKDTGSPTVPVLTRERLTEKSEMKSSPKMAFIEYHGLGNVPPSYVDPVTTPNIRLMDCFNNTFRALRFVNHPKWGDLLFAEFGSDFLFQGKLAMTEVYNCSVDPWNTHNLAADGSFDPAQAAELHELLLGLWGCKGTACANFFT